MGGGGGRGGRGAVEKQIRTAWGPRPTHVGSYTIVGLAQLQKIKPCVALGQGCIRREGTSEAA